MRYLQLQLLGLNSKLYIAIDPRLLIRQIIESPVSVRHTQTSPNEVQFIFSTASRFIPMICTKFVKSIRNKMLNVKVLARRSKL